MREILFRGKRKDNGEWVEGWLTEDTVVGSECYKALVIIEKTEKIFEAGWNEIIPETVSEWTGLYDKNGVRIFEGDILQLCNGTYPIEVIYDGLGWKFIRNGKRVKGAFECDIIHDIEICKVIGNIHDNKLEDFENGC